MSLPKIQDVRILLLHLKLTSFLNIGEIMVLLCLKRCYGSSFLSRSQCPSRGHQAITILTIGHHSLFFTSSIMCWPLWSHCHPHLQGLGLFLPSDTVFYELCTWPTLKVLFPHYFLNKGHPGHPIYN